ncbi:MAG: ATP-binding cassette domain-containing protein, partial [Acidimicrobiaceae bacterium]|nr:ATP-binding cassette domain-containing protein [Acidimicrobiaceae bacterium]
HFSLIERLRVWENVALAHRGKLAKREALRTVSEIGDRYGMRIDGMARVESLTVGQRQRVELIKCLSLQPSILVLDEPTSVLTAAESLELFRVLRDVVDRERLAVILISHKLDEVLQATDRVTIMRDGRVVANLITAETSAEELARDMVGRPVLLRAEMAAVGALGLEESAAADDEQPASAVVPPVTEAQAEASLVLEGITVTDKDGINLLDDFSIVINRGEIVGLAGVEGNGQAALDDLMSGLVSPRKGRVLVAGQPVNPRPRALMAAGVGIIPEDRHRSGCVLQMSVEDNLVAVDLDAIPRKGGVLLNRRAIRHRAKELMAEYQITAASPVAPMRSLSGGNQQRVVVARELSQHPKVLIAIQPTRGLDVGAVEYMSEQMRRAAKDGIGILLVSTELEEILAIADRIVVISRGRNVGEMARRDVDMQRIGLLMGGST